MSGATHRMSARITFAAALRAKPNAALRQKVLSDLTSCPGTLRVRVDTVPAALARLGRASRSRRGVHLLLDLHRVLLYDATGRGVPGIDSVLRSLADAYPCQPRALVVEHARVHPYRFLYALGSLDVVPLLWAVRQVGVLSVADLLTGEIRHTTARPHPESARAGDSAPTVIHYGTSHGLFPPRPQRVRRRWTDATLRAELRADLADLISVDAGVIRDRIDLMSHASLPISVTRVADPRGSQPHICSGKGTQRDAAALVATCEALERYHIAFKRPREQLVCAAFSELTVERAVDPRTLFFGSAPSAAHSEGFAPYTDAQPMLWTWATELGSERSLLIPAQEVWFNTDRFPGERRFVNTTSSGCAVGNSLEEASLFALLEAIERDAYLTGWYVRRRCSRIDLDAIRHESFQLLRKRWHAAFPSYDFALYDITSDTRIPAVAGIAFRLRGTGPRTFHATAARLCAERACYAVLKDLTGFAPEVPPERRARWSELLADPARIRTPENHFEFYALDDAMDRIDVAFGASGHITDTTAMNRACVVPEAARYDLRSVLHQVAGHLQTIGASILIKDITHAEFRRRGIRCVKAVTPNLYPLWFGLASARFSVTPRLQRLAREFTGRPLTTREDFNVSVHPLT